MMSSNKDIPQLEHYDLIVIGSGPGGQKAAVAAAKQKKKVLVIEKEKVGGACLHTGTIPSKALREAALNRVDADSLQTIMARTRHVIDDESHVISAQLKRNNVEYITGTGSFLKAHQIQIENSAGIYTVESKFILIGTGTRPRHPAGIQFDDTCIFDSDTVLEMKKQPKTMLVVGAGVIGCEYASIYARLGISVCLADVRDQLLPTIDQEIVAALIKQFEKDKIQLLMGYDTKEVLKKASQVSVKLVSAQKKETKDMMFDAVLYCAGRIGNVESLNLKLAGIQTDDRGLIKVNNNYQTTTPNVYAVGDVVGFPALAASSAEQGRLATLHALNAKEVHFPATFPYGIYTIPEISSVGLQEADLKKTDTEYVVGLALYRELARGKIIDDENGFLKLLVDVATSKILGVHVIGTGATELIHIGQVAMAFHASAEFFVDNVFNYPTLAEAYKVAALNAMNKIRFRNEEYLARIDTD
jgi:NAD(P) transhydrogenase